LYDLFMRETAGDFHDLLSSRRLLRRSLRQAQRGPGP